MIRSSIVGTLALMALSSVAAAQRATSSWDQLVVVAPVGHKVVVTRVDNTRVTGKLLDINAQTITLQGTSGGIAIDAPGVWRVQRHTLKRTSVKLIPWEALAGGVLLLAIDSQSGNPEPANAFIGGVILGAAAGGITALAMPSGRLLFERPTLRSAAGSRLPARHSFE